jgi:1-acyl-sn-glycerol-3-phosphate acyltransferase
VQEVDDWKLEPARDLGLTGLARSRSLRRESGLVESLARWCTWSGIRAGLKLVHRMKVHGLDNLPDNPSFVMVANHASHLDALVLGSAVRLAWRDHIFPIAAGDVFYEHRGLAALVTTLLNALPIWRNKGGAQQVKQLRQRLVEEACIYLLFPEGARTRTGQMLPFKSGIGMLVAQTSVPVVPCYLHGTFEAFPANRIVPQPHRITLRIGAPLRFDKVPNEREGWEEIAQTIETAVCRLRDGELAA